MKTTYEIYQQNTLCAARISTADTFFERFRGLMLRRTLGGEGLLLLRCGSIHCFFMRFTIDAVYLDKDMRVIAVETVRPWRIGGIYKGAKHVLELEEGKGSIFRIGIPIEQRKDGRKNA